ncbi:conserved hypothetical protein [Neorickettsia risticii str. Illinois]|uniref:Uncharacterized protein n=1 Tax=Neorickettsia risticii (strain Illinois) TaxID=434131 RepID=C6V5C9_NEORI|nr:hypothetical protein [Neorickettsia risticii]ACT69602.1 conserved hypothetical protein [Neorickettsia risticii str. Illinois]
MEKKVAEEIVNEIKRSIREALASFDGADSKYYQRLYKYFYEQQKKIAQISGLPLRTIEEIVILVGKKRVLPIGKELFKEEVQYIIENLSSSDTRERDQLRIREKEQEEEREDEQERKDEIEEELGTDLLAKLSERKQKQDAKEILKRLLICMIAARMDPRRRAGESIESNARSAKTYGREGQVSLKDLVRAGVVSAAVLLRLNAQGISGNASLSVSKIQSFIATQFESIINLIRGEDFGRLATRVPNRSQGLLTLAKVNNSLGIFTEKASNVGVGSNISAGFTPFVDRKSKESDRGR